MAALIRLGGELCSPDWAPVRIIARPLFAGSRSPKVTYAADRADPSDLLRAGIARMLVCGSTGF